MVASIQLTFPSQWNNVWILQEKYMYLLLTKFEVRTVSEGPSFFPFDLWPKREVRRP